MFLIVGDQNSTDCILNLFSGAYSLSAILNSISGLVILSTAARVSDCRPSTDCLTSRDRARSNHSERNLAPISHVPILLLDVVADTGNEALLMQWRNNPNVILVQLATRDGGPKSLPDVPHVGVVAWIARTVICFADSTIRLRDVQQSPWSHKEGANIVDKNLQGLSRL